MDFLQPQDVRPKANEETTRAVTKRIMVEVECGFSEWTEGRDYFVGSL